MFQGANIIGNNHYVRKDFSAINPCNESVYGEFPESTKEEIDAAVNEARNNFVSWRAVSRVKRADLFYNLGKLVEKDINILTNIISIETGKSHNESRAEVIEALHMCQLVAGSGRIACGEWMASEVEAKDAYVIRKPKGVVAVISPWNFPLAIGSFWASAPALVEGNCVVHKPSELTPWIAQYVASLYLEAGFPPGVYNLIHGGGNVGEELTKHPQVDCILFTGSAEVGQKIKRICADTWHKTCSTETGSKSATILFEDGNQDLAIEAMIASAFKLSGQRCVSSGRMLIQRSIYDDFCEKFVREVKGRVTVGSPIEGSYCGPLINEKQRDRVTYQNYLTSLYPEVKILMHGERPNRPGYYLTPHIYKTEWSDAEFLRKEVFGPHVALIPFTSLENAIRIYNDTEYGLSVGIITENFRTMRKCRDECNAGMIYLNGGSVAAESHLPFTGIKKSGNYHSSASGTYQACTYKVSVTLNHEQGITWAQGLK